MIDEGIKGERLHPVEAFKGNTTEIIDLLLIITEITDIHFGLS